MERVVQRLETPMGMRVFHLFVDGVKVSTAQLEMSGEVAWICTYGKHLRRGYATYLWNWMVSTGEEPKHSPCRLIEGDRWARKVGGELPPLHKIPCNKCGSDFF